MTGYKHRMSLVHAFCMVISIYPLGVVCAGEPGPAVTEALLSRIETNKKLHYPDALLAGLRAGRPEIDVIVTLETTQVASVLASQSAFKAKIPEPFKNSGAPTYFDLEDDNIRKALQSSVNERVSQVISRLPKSGIKITHKFNYQFGFSAKVTAPALETILNDPTVIRVEKDEVLEPHLAQGIPVIDASNPRLSYNGAGISIAICDTGIDTSHPKLGNGGAPIFNSKVIGGYNTGDKNSDPRPQGDAHGTACAGIAAGDLGTVGDYIGGVAPGSKLYSLKISYGSSGEAYDSAMIAAWEWVIANRNKDPANPIKVISTSFGGGQYSGTCDGEVPAMTTAAANAVAAGITLFASSGNDGYCDSVAWPACISYVNSVGAVYDADIGAPGWCVSQYSCANKSANSGCATGWAAFEASTNAGKVTLYSNSASILTLFASSNNAYTTDIVGTGGYNKATSLNGGDYVPNFGGTSAASPYAAGAAAVLQSAAKAKTGSFLTPAQVREYLTASGNSVTDGKSGIVKPLIDLDRAVANLPTSTFYITVNRNPVGGGTASCSPNPVNQGQSSTCNASAATGYRFTSWSGDCSGTSPSCTISNITSNKTVTANFTVTYALAVTKNVSAGGTVISSPAGINCGATCSYAFNGGQSVALTPTPANGYYFSSWSGACSGSEACTVTMDAAKTVNANFTAIPVGHSVLSVTKTGLGSVTSAPVGINCSGTCNATFANGTIVTLTAAPVTGYYFSGWTGACTGQGTCKLNIDGNRSAAATFTQIPANQQLLTVSVSGAGSIVSNPAGLSCSSTCSYPFANNTAVSLVATPMPGNTFMGWAGEGCTGKGSCMVTMNVPKSVTASFQNTYNLIMPAINNLLLLSED